MVNSSKRIEAIAELYESEKYYLKDLDLWISMIRRNILGIGRVKLSGKYTSFSCILSHITAIYDLHAKIFEKLKEKNAFVLKQNRIKHSTSNARDGSEPSGEAAQDLDMDQLKHANVNSSDLEYYSTYSSLFSFFSCYVKYFENLPKAEYYFKRLMFMDEYFGKIVMSYMKDNNAMDLGINHFMYRPSAKISRYPIFFNAIAKREPDPAKKAEYQKVAKNFDTLIKHLEDVFNNRKSQFETFILSYRFVFGSEVRNKFSLGLIYKKNKLISSRKIIVKKDRLQPASYKDVYLFNRMILICLTTENEFENVVIDDDPIFLSKLYLVKRGIDEFAPNENLEMLYPLFLVQKENRSIKALYFSDETNREIFYKSTQKAIKQVRGNMDKSIKIVEVVRHEEDLNCVCKPESGRNSFISSYGGDDQRESNVSDGTEEYIEYHIDSHGERKGGDYSDIKDVSTNMSGSKESFSGTKGVSGGEYGRSANKHGGHATDSTSSGSVVFDNHADYRHSKNAYIHGNHITDSTNSSNIVLDTSYVSHEKHSKVIPSNTTASGSLDREDMASENLWRYGDDLPHFQETSDDACGGWVHISDSDTSNKSENHVEYNFDHFGAEDDVPSDASSVSSKAYSDIFPEEVDKAFNAGSTPSSSTQTEPEKKGGFFSELFKHTAMPLNQVSIECSYQYERNLRNRLMLIYSNRNGIFKALRREQVSEGLDAECTRDTKIYEEPAEKILYDPDLELLIFHSGDYAYISIFHADSVRLEPQQINTTIKDFFYGRFKGTAYIALVTNEEYSFSIIHLLKVEYNIELAFLEIKVVRKLYVGFTIFNISFLRGRIIISCKDFEVIEIDTLRTQELLEVYDTSISLLLGPKEHFLARSIFKLDINTFLLCFNGGGYLIDRTGRYKYNNVSFSWEILGEEFKVFRKWIVVVGRSYVTIFEMETGKMIFMEYMPGMRLVQGTQIPLIYSGKSVYLVDFGESCKEEYERCKVYSFGNMPINDEAVPQCSETYSSHIVEEQPPGDGIPHADDLEPNKQDASVSAAIDNFFFQSFSTQSLISVPSTNWNSTTLEYDSRATASLGKADAEESPGPSDGTADSGNRASNYHATHKIDMKKFRERYKKYTPSSTHDAADIRQFQLGDPHPLSRKPISQRSQRLLREILHGRSGNQRSFKLEPKGNYKVCMAQPNPLSSLVLKARERKIRTLKRYGAKKRRMWRERNLASSNKKADEMDIIGKYKE